MNGFINPGRASAWRIGLATASAVAMAAAATGCGSDSTTTSSATGGTTAAAPAASAEAANIVAAATKPITSWNGFGKAIKPPSGKRIVAIECSSLGVGCVQGAEATKEAGDVLGWSTDIVNGKGDPTVWNSAIQTAVSSKADGIVLFAISPALVKDGIAKAKAAGVPVAAAFVGPKADALSVVDAAAGGKIMGGHLADVTAGKGNVLVLNDGEFSLTVQRNTAMTTELSTLCPACKTKKVEFTFATMPTKLAGQVASALQADPTINRVTVPFDAATTFVRQGIQQSGSKATIASFEGDPATMKTIGDGVQEADLAGPNVWTGWQAVDNLARLMTDQPVSDAPLPVRLFTAENKAEAVGWDGDLDFRAKYKELWGKG